MVLSADFHSSLSSEDVDGVIRGGGQRSDNSETQIFYLLNNHHIQRKQSSKVISYHTLIWHTLRRVRVFSTGIYSVRRVLVLIDVVADTQDDFITDVDAAITVSRLYNPPHVTDRRRHERSWRLSGSRWTHTDQIGLRQHDRLH